MMDTLLCLIYLQYKYIHTYLHMFKNSIFQIFFTLDPDPFFRLGPDASGYRVFGISGYPGRHPAVPYSAYEVII